MKICPSRLLLTALVLILLAATTFKAQTSAVASKTLVLSNATVIAE